MGGWGSTFLKLGILRARSPVTHPTKCIQLRVCHCIESLLGVHPFPQEVCFNPSFVSGKPEAQGDETTGLRSHSLSALNSTWPPGPAMSSRPPARGEPGEGEPDGHEQGRFWSGMGPHGWWWGSAGVPGLRVPFPGKKLAKEGRRWRDQESRSQF